MRLGEGDLGFCPSEFGPFLRTHLLRLSRPSIDVRATSSGATFPKLLLSSACCCVRRLSRKIPNVAP